MNIFLTSAIFLIAIQAQAQVIISKGSSILSDPGLRNICRQMTSDHLNDIAELNQLYKELKLVIDQNYFADNSEKISSLVNQIKEYSGRIQYLSKPEWNTETIPIQLTWTVSNDLFFDNSDYLKLKGEVQAKWSGRPPNLYKYITYNVDHVSEKKLISTKFLNSTKSDISEFLSLDGSSDYRSEYARDRSFVIVYKKNVTALEACQFLKTLLFEVKISFVKYINLGDYHSKLGSDKTIYLIYRNEVEDEI